jgi:hypothetical protein
MDPTLVPAKLKGLALGPDVKQGGKTVHTLWVANNNDFLTQLPDKNKNLVPNPKSVLRLRLHRRRPRGFETGAATIQILPLVNAPEGAPSKLRLGGDFLR